MSTPIAFQVSAQVVPNDHGHLDGPGVATGAGPGLGGIVLVVMITAIVVVGVVLFRQRLSPRQFRIALSCSLAVAVAGLLVATVPAGGRAPASGVPVLRTLELPERQVPVVVVPNRPGFNLVGVNAPDASAGPAQDRLTVGRQQPGSAMTWVPVELPEGSSRLWVSTGGVTDTVTVDTGDGGPGPAALAGSDGTECASSVVGALLAGKAGVPETCPADALTEPDAAALRSIVRFLAERGEKQIAVAGDDSPRATAAAGEVRAAAEREGLTTVPLGTGRHPVVVVAGWEEADSVLKNMAAEAAVQGAYLAPWLATTSLLEQNISPQIALRYEPRDPAAGEYLAALSNGIPGEAPSTAGYQAWQEARGSTDTAPVRMYSAAVHYMPGMGGATTHQHQQAADWLPGGMIVPVTGPLNEM